MRLGFTLVFVILFCSVVTLSAQPSNDNCENPIPILNIAGSCTNPFKGTNVGATVSSYSKASCFATNANDVWYSFTAIGTDVTVTILGGSSGGALRQPEVALYRGTCATSISELRCATDTRGNNIVELYRGALTIGETYLIRVQGRNGATGTFDLCINNYNPPVEPGSDCPIASVLCDKSPFVVQQVSGVGNNADEADNSCLDQDKNGTDLGNSESSSTWFVWTAATSGSLTFTITPLNPNDDIDFALFELPNGVGNCSGKILVRCMATACTGPTGLNMISTETTEDINCDAGEDGFIRFLDMQAGKSYGLLINNFSNTGNGFQIEFGGDGEFLGPQADFTISDPDQIVCVGEEFTVTDASSFGLGSITKREWQFGVSASIATASTTGPHTISYNSPGLKSIVLIVTSDKGCIVTHVETIMVECCGDHFTADGQVSNLTCPGTNDGAIDLTVMSDFAPYTFVWNDSLSNNEDLTGLPEGSYTVTITDQSTCDTVLTFDVSGRPDMTFDTLVTMPTCGGGTDGAVTLVVNGATPPYQYNWQNSGFGPDNGLTNISRGDYTVIVRDANGCDTTLVLPVRELELVLDPSVEAVTQPTCNGFSNGSIIVDIANGLGPFRYDWNDGLGFRDENSLQDVRAGVYIVQVRDANLCEGNFTFNMEDHPPVTLSFDTENASCNGTTDGSATVIPSGGVGNYTYSWSNGETKKTITDLPAGTYSITVRDANQCEITRDTIITEPEAILIEVTNVINLICNGAPTGAVTVAGSGGTMPYNYSINGNSFQPEPTFNGLPAGDYTIIIEDAEGCQSTTDATIIQPPALVVDAGEDQTIELGYTVDLQAIANDFNVVFSWSPPDGLSCVDCPDPTSMPARTTVYTVTIVDEDNCTASDSLKVTVTINRPLYAPSAFSPNGDGANDYFTIFGGPGAKQIRKLVVFDRWGNMVFETNDVPLGQERFGWDGTFNGKPMSPGVFAYYTEVEFIDEIIVSKEGDITIVK